MDLFGDISEQFRLRVVQMHLMGELLQFHQLAVSQAPPLEYDIAAILKCRWVAVQWVHG